MKKKADPEAIKNEMMTYLEAKYGEEFVPMSLSLSNFANSYDSLRAYPKNGNKGDSFEVWGTRMEDGSYSMSDGYFGIYIKPKYEAVLSGVVRDIYKEFKLFTDFGEGILPDRLNKDTKIEEIYNKDEHFRSNTILFVKQESAKGIDDEVSLRTIAEKMLEKKMVGDIDLYVVIDDKYDSIGLEALNVIPSKEKDYFLHDQTSITVSIDLTIKKY
ncbi:hypothetical protein [Paenibacillus segetis]|uniref:Uncharacterized protein n=1 Tax=Paenibacillus segetis TaxID=1325360 RepID=A0ABQ1Y3H6_9BACL|nr:hypothetical protein [Paenibacillus segetis]GGH11093.1 hypothetical protein GCM10008013_02790 [Paenibacillus segetis]